MKQNIEITVTPTEQEKKVVEMLANGLKGNHIAEKLRTSESGVAANLAEIRRKYNCKNSTELVALFFRKKLIS